MSERRDGGYQLRHELAYHVERVPTSPILASAKYDTVPVFHMTVDLLIRFGTGWHDPGEVFNEACGRHIRVSKAHLGMDTTAIPRQGEPIVEVIGEMGDGPSKKIY